MTRRIGVLGGTFDPIHYGHLNAAAQAADSLGLDRVIFVPAGLPWQKHDRDIAHASHRFNMCLLATAGNPIFDVSRIEIDRDGPTYTAPTLRELAAQDAYRGADIYFITGADALGSLPTWHEYPALLELATFVGVTRPGHDLETSDDAGSYRLLATPGIDISSSMIRDRIARGESIDYLLPWPVISYLRKYALYLPEDQT